LLLVLFACSLLRRKHENKNRTTTNASAFKHNILPTTTHPLQSELTMLVLLLALLVLFACSLLRRKHENKNREQQPTLQLSNRTTTNTKLLCPPPPYRLTAPIKTASQAFKQGDVDRVFDSLDTNKDQVLTREEFAAAASKVAPL
jgi:hypothetical protein